MMKRRVQSRRRGGSVHPVGPDEERPKRPGTPYRISVQTRPINQLRFCESASPVQNANAHSFQDAEENSGNPRNNFRRPRSINRASDETSNSLSCHDHQRESHGRHSYEDHTIKYYKSPHACFPLSEGENSADGDDNHETFLKFHNIKRKHYEQAVETCEDESFSSMVPPPKTLKPKPEKHRRPPEIINKRKQRSSKTIQTSPPDGADSKLKRSSCFNCIGDGLKRLKVPEHVIFDTWKDAYSFQASLVLTNVSKYPMTFNVKTSEPEMFSISPAIGIIDPKSQTRVKIRTNRLYEFNFDDVANEIFKIFATPLNGRKTMDQDTLALTWQAFGTKSFPRKTAEEHTILRLYQRNAEFSARTFLTWLRPWIFDTPEKSVKIDLSVDERFGSNSWPMEDNNYAFKAFRNQVYGWHSLENQTKAETQRLRYEVRRGIAWLLISIMIVALLAVISNESRPIAKHANQSRIFMDQSFTHLYEWVRNIFSEDSPKDLFSFEYWQKRFATPSTV